MTIGERIVQDLKEAMAAKDAARLGAIRLIRAEFLKAEKEKGQKLDEAREMAILQTMAKQRRESIEQFEAGGRKEMADQERAELAIIESYLPKGLNPEEIQSVIAEVLAEIQSPQPSQLGQIMGQVMGRLKQTGRPFDGKAVNTLVKEKLGG